MRALRWLWLWGIFLLSSCAHFRGAPDEAEARRVPAGWVHSVNLPQRYLIFESEEPMAAGTRLQILRNGGEIGRARVLSLRRRKFQSADILEGVPAAGDLLEPLSAGPL